MAINGSEDPRPIGLSRATEHGGFKALGIAVIGLAFVLAVMESYPATAVKHEGLLRVLNSTVVWLFTAELCFNIGAYGRKPLRFFRSGWNWFDFLIVAVSVPFEFIAMEGGGYIGNQSSSRAEIAQGSSCLETTSGCCGDGLWKHTSVSSSYDNYLADLFGSGSGRNSAVWARYWCQ